MYDSLKYEEEKGGITEKFSSYNNNNNITSPQVPQQLYFTLDCYFEFLFFRLPPINIIPLLSLYTYFITHKHWYMPCPIFYMDSISEYP